MAALETERAQAPRSTPKLLEERAPQAAAAAVTRLEAAASVHASRSLDSGAGSLNAASTSLRSERSGVTGRWSDGAPKTWSDGALAETTVQSISLYTKQTKLAALLWVWQPRVEAILMDRMRLASFERQLLQEVPLLNQEQNGI